MICLLSWNSAQAQKRSVLTMPSPAIQDRLGVNIHFTHPRPGEIKMIADAGLQWIRMDFTWSSMEKEKGVYDFTAYEGLIDSLNKYHLKAILILDYGNELYDGGLAPHSPEAIGAFTRWAAAAVSHFAGNGILWEMWNEPNGDEFWKPKADVQAYIRLALATGEAIRNAAPEEIYIGPATSGVPLWFLEACFRAGLLEYWDAVSIHPYRSDRGNPETVIKNYRDVRELIGKYAPSGRTIPVISSEWGYSSAWEGYTPEKQGKHLAREFLINLSEHIPVSIFYDWHDDGIDADSTKPVDANHFGIVAHTYYAQRDPVYNSKPAYLAAKTLTHTLHGFHFDKRIPTGNSNHYILAFRKGKKRGLVAWTTQQSDTVRLKTIRGKFKGYDYVGERLAGIKRDRNGLKIALTDAPQYLIPAK